MQIGKIKMNNQQLPLQELLIRTEVLKHDFTKRQMNIISMIFQLSYYLGKSKAIIPKMMDFELCGISKIKVRSELQKLVEMKVVLWDEEENSFSINDPREWIGAKYHSGYNDNRAKDLFILNMKDMGIDVSLD